MQVWRAVMIFSFDLTFSCVEQYSFKVGLHEAVTTNAIVFDRVLHIMSVYPVAYKQLRLVREPVSPEAFFTIAFQRTSVVFTFILTGISFSLSYYVINTKR